MRGTLARRAGRPASVSITAASWRHDLRESRTRPYEAYPCLEAQVTRLASKGMCPHVRIALIEFFI